MGRSGGSQRQPCEPTDRNVIEGRDPQGDLGTSKRHAILTGISRKGYWRLSKTLATQTGMTNEWFEEQGLLSIRKLWMKAQGYVS